MFVKSTKGTDLIQSVLFGVGVAAVAIIFVSLIQGGFRVAGGSVNTANSGLAGSLDDAAAAIPAP